MPPITLVACCGSKVAVPSKASDLYTSSLFAKSRTYAEMHGAWFILSAKYGLLATDKVVEPYDLTLVKMRAQSRMKWGEMVKRQMQGAGIFGSQFVALAGNDYVKPLVALGVSIEQPMRGLGIGQQLQWLNRFLAQANSKYGTK
jgi:hypothetical protein